MSPTTPVAAAAASAAPAPSPLRGLSLNDVYAMCEQITERMPSLSASELSAQLAAIESSSRALINANARAGSSASAIGGEVLDELSKTVSRTVAFGEKYLWETQLGTNNGAKEREVLADLDKWAESRDERRQAQVVVKKDEWPTSEDVNGSAPDSTIVLRDLERRFPERPRAVLVGVDDGELRAAGKKRREEVLLEIDNALSSLTNEHAIVVAQTVGDGSAAIYIKPVIDFIQGQSDFVRKSIAIAIACTIIAVALIEFFVEEQTSELETLVASSTSGAT